jgi:hypothetical protein
MRHKFNDRELNEQLAIGAVTLDQARMLRQGQIVRPTSGPLTSCELVYLPERQGVKYDGSKLPLHLLDVQALEGLAAVLDFGQKKYTAENWRGGISYTRLIAALLRHIFAILRGEDIDPESNLPHIDHVGCCWMFLSNMMKTRLDLDDRYKNLSQEKS